PHPLSSSSISTATSHISSLSLHDALPIFINIGMWFERYVIIATSLNRDFLPSSWGDFTATPVDMGLYLGTFGLFFTLFLLFVRWIPMFAIAELKGVLPQAHPHLGGHGHEEPAAKGELAPAPAE